MNEGKLLNLLKQAQLQFSVDALKRPQERDAFEYGYRVGVVAGYEAAIGVLLKLIEEEKSGGNDFEDALAEAFPDVNPGVQPFGSRVLVQIRTPRKVTKGGIILSSDTQDTEKWNTQVAKVVSVGSLAFRNRTTQEYWPEGAWCVQGDFVRVPKYGGDRWEVAINRDDSAMFVIFNDLDIIGQVTGDPLTVKAFI